MSRLVRAVSLLGLLAGCGHIGVVGLEPRSDGDVELEIVGPVGTDPTSCTNPRFVDEPTTHYAIDRRCDARVTRER